MIRPLAVLLLAAVVAASSATAQIAPQLAKVREAYERLCTGDGAGSAEACAALRAEMDALTRPRAAAPAPKAVVIPASNPAPSLASLRAAEAARVRNAYERLCTGDGAGGAAACTALRLEVEKAGVPGTKGWSGLVVAPPDQGIKAVRVFAMVPGSPGQRAGLRMGDLIIALDGEPVSSADDFAAAIRASLVGQQIGFGVLRGDQVLDIPVKLAAEPRPNPRLNSQRGEKSRYSLWSGTAATVDPMNVGEVFDGIIERDDGGDGKSRADCIELPAAKSGQNLTAELTPNGTLTRIFAMSGTCTLYGGANSAVSDGKTRVKVDFASQAGAKTYIVVMGEASAQPYQVIVREQTPSETFAWNERKRQLQIAEQQRIQAERQAAAERADFLGGLASAVIGGVAMGYAGVDVADMPSSGNLMDMLNVANSTAQRNAQESADRLNDTIARAQRKAEQDRRDKLEREEFERQRIARQQATQQQPQPPRPGASGAIVVSQSPSSPPQAAPPPMPVSRPTPPPIPVAAPSPSRPAASSPRSCTTSTVMAAVNTEFQFSTNDQKNYQSEGRVKALEAAANHCKGGVMNTFQCSHIGFGMFTCGLKLSCPEQKTQCTPGARVSAQ